MSKNNKKRDQSLKFLWEVFRVEYKNEVYYVHDLLSNKPLLKGRKVTISKGKINPKNGIIKMWGFEELLNELPKVQTYSAFVKSNSPTKYSTQDSTLGIRYTIDPTMKRLGFTLTREERDADLTPLEQAIQMMPKGKKKGVYNVYRHPQGYSNHLELYYK